MTRREFIVGSVAASGLRGFGGATRRGPRPAFQVYGVRDLCAKDLLGTLKAAKAMGYEGVETGRFTVDARRTGRRCARTSGWSLSHCSSIRTR